MPSIMDAVANLQGQGLPVLFLDACSIVDVIRGPARHDQLAGCVAAGAELLHMATVPPVRCVLVVASFVPHEWLDHAQPEVKNLTKHLRRLDEQAGDFHDACAAIGLVPPFARPSYDSVGLVAGLEVLSKGLLDAAIHLDAHNDTNMRAFARAVAKVPPSGKGGEIKDATITEECLEVSRQLHAAAFARKRVFCTSNTNDYCEAGGLHADLAAEFALVGLDFVTNLPWAVSEMKT
jgi:hypothetical protein